MHDVTYLRLINLFYVCYNTALNLQISASTAVKNIIISYCVGDSSQFYFLTLDLSLTCSPTWEKGTPNAKKFENTG